MGRIPGRRVLWGAIGILLPFVLVADLWGSTHRSVEHAVAATSTATGIPTGTPAARFAPITYTVTVVPSTTRLIVGQRLRVAVSTNVGLPLYSLNFDPAVLQAVAPRADASGHIRQAGRTYETTFFLLKAIRPGKTVISAGANGEIQAPDGRGGYSFQWGNAGGTSVPIVVTAGGTGH